MARMGGRTGFGGVVAVAAAVVALAGCSNSGSGLTTASVLGSPASAAGTEAKPITPQERAVQVAAVSARAVKCGYNFDPGKLKANYIASEQRGGLEGLQLTQIDQLYDKTNTAVRLAIQSDGDYCTEAKNREIKADLTRHLAGDFAPPAKPTVAAKETGGWFGWLQQDKPTGREVINPNIWEQGAPKTVRAPE